MGGGQLPEKASLFEGNMKLEGLGDKNQAGAAARGRARRRRPPTPTARGRRARGGPREAGRPRGSGLDPRAVEKSRESFRHREMQGGG